MNNSVDIIIPTRGRGTLIDETSASIRASSHHAFTLWVADQSDDAATARAVLPHVENDARVRYLRVPPTGSSAARNIGAAAGDAPYILFTDDDCVVDPSWVTEMIRELAEPQTWAVFGRVVPDDDEAVRDSKELRGIWLARKDSNTRQVFAGDRFNLGFGHGANMGFRRDCYVAVAGFDELLGVGARFRSWPERDIGYRILRRGGQIVYAPGALAHHRHWRAWDGVRRTLRNYALGTGAAVGKYVRCGDWRAAYLLFEWLLDQGVRQILSGALKWRSPQKMQAGIIQLIYPWAGLIDSARAPVDRDLILYRKTPKP